VGVEGGGATYPLGVSLEASSADLRTANSNGPVSAVIGRPRVVDQLANTAKVGGVGDDRGSSYDDDAPPATPHAGDPPGRRWHSGRRPLPLRPLPADLWGLDRAKGVVLAAMAGLALTAAEEHDDEARHTLQVALTTQTMIGQAQGILMERERITADQAFDILRRASQHLNTKIRDVVQALVDTGESPQTG
jgi:ANTAR domain-containing protein